MPKLIRLSFTDDVDGGLNAAEKELRRWLGKDNIEVLRWQIVPVLFPYKASPLDLGLSWKSEVELFIEHKEK